MASLQDVLDTQTLTDSFFTPWLQERLATYGGSNASALNGSHGSPVGATVLTMIASGAWYREAVRMVRTEFGDAAAELFLRMPASGVCNERSIEASFGRIVSGGIMTPAPDALQYLQRRAHDFLSMLKRTCTHPAVLLKGCGAHSTYDPLHEDADESPLCGRRPAFSAIASLIPRRSEQPQAPPLEEVRDAERFCGLLGPKLACRPVMAIYRPPAGAKPNVPQPVNRARENARIGDGVFDQAPTGCGAARTYKVTARAGSCMIQPGSVVVMMPREVIAAEPYWLAEVTALVELPDEDEYASTSIAVRYLERFNTSCGRLFCAGKATRVFISRILKGVDETLEVHALEFREPTIADRRRKLPAAATMPLSRVYELTEEKNAALVAVAAHARANIAAQAAQDEAERAAADVDDEEQFDADAEVEAAAALQERAAQAAAARERNYGAPEPGAKRARPAAAGADICCDCTEEGHRRKSSKLCRLYVPPLRAAAAEAGPAAEPNSYEAMRLANIRHNMDVLSALADGAGAAGLGKEK